jgi:hypothetical protein
MVVKMCSAMSKCIGSLFAAALVFSTLLPGGANAYKHERRTSIVGASVAYWGVERHALADRKSKVRSRFSPGAASVDQLDRRLRRRGDGDLAEALVNEPTPETERLLKRYDIPVVKGVPPITYLNSGKRGPRNHFRGRR